MRRKFFKGFTLIELLIVVAIIGVISGILFVSVGQAPLRKARDAKRMHDLGQIKLALNLFFVEYGYYPAHRDQTGCGAWAPRSSSGYLNCGGADGTWLTSDANFSNFLLQTPVDPINTICLGWPGGCYAEDGVYNYTYSSSDGTGYDLRTLLEDTNNPDRCEAKCYNTHPGGYTPGASWAWCANHGSPICGGIPWWDNASQPQLYSDH